MKYLLVLPVVLLPSIAFGATGSLQTLMSGIGGFINNAVIPLMLGFAFLVFIINAVRFFVIGGNNEEGQENAKNLAVYGVGAFVLILSFWGIVNVLSSSIGLNEDNCVDGKTIQSDYLKENPPCSSPRPLSRPADLQRPIVDTPITTTTLPPPTTGSITSFNPNGDPIIYTPVNTALDTIQNKSASYIKDDMSVIYGDNASVVSAALFNDINLQGNSDTVELKRLQAAYRLREAGIITGSELNTYLDAVTTYQKAVSVTDTKISDNSIADIKASLPTSVLSNINKNKNELTLILNEYNRDIDFGTKIDVPAAIDKLFNSSIPAKERLNNFNELYNSEQKYIPGNQYPARDAFYSNYNTENAFNGVFDPEV